MQSKKTLKLGIVAGEHSGDRLGAEIIQALKSTYNIELFGVGGPRISQEGLKSEFDFNKLHVMGLIEPLINIRELTRLRKELIKLFLDKQVDYFVGVDSPDFNMSIHKALKKRSTSKNIQLVSPSVWGWRENRIKSIKKYIDLTVCLFNFEHNYYKKKEMNSIHLGHPFSEMYSSDNEFVINKYNLDGRKKFMAVLPGSRKSEIKNMLPTYISFMKQHHTKYPEYTYLIPVADKSTMEYIQTNFSFEDLPIIIDINCSKDFLSISKLSVVTSGTATLEAAILGAEPIICYKTASLNYFIISRMLKVNDVGLPNLLLDSRQFPELIQKACTAQSILQEAEIIQARDSNDMIVNKLRNLLRGKGREEVVKRISLL